LGHANIVKLTDEELQCVTTLLTPNNGGLEQLARQLLCEWNLRLVCVTRGARGSLIVSESEAVEHDGFPAKVADTVGAGDAFTASLAHHLVRGHPLREICEASNQFASWVTTQTGATPKIDQLQLRMVLSGRCKTGQFPINQPRIENQ
jgi:fructokinase